MRAALTDAAVIFDLDGTLVDTAEDLAAAMNHALTKAGLKEIDPARVRKLVGLGARAMLTQGFAEGGGPQPTPSQMDAHIAVFLEHYTAHIADRSRPFPGAIAAIEALTGQGARIAVCTNKREAPARLLLDKLEIGGLFDAIVGVDTIGIGKPDPRPVLHALAGTGRPVAVFVGDSDVDALAAEAAGMPFLAATFGYGPFTRTDKIAASFDSYAELPELAARVLR